MLGAFDMVYCPFCAYRGRLIDFRLTLESGGYSRKQYRCPDCGQVMRKATLKMRISIEEWAEWLYISIRMWNKPEYKFYDKISWEKLWSRLYKYGFGERFLKAWKNIKIRYAMRGEQDGEVKIADDYIGKLIDKGFEGTVKQLKLGEIKK